MTGRLDRLAAAPWTAASVAAPADGPSITCHTASSPPACHAACRTGSSHAPSASIETPRGPVRRTCPRMTSNQEWNSVEA